MGREAKANIDWEGIEREYRAGQLSLSEIGVMFGISKGRISQVAKKEQWKQDLSSRIKAQAIAKLSDRLVSAELNAPVREASDEARVAAGAEALTKVVLSHQSSVRTLRERVKSYNEELAVCGDSLGERARILKALSETEKILVALERQAYGIDNANGEADKPAEVPPMSNNEAARRVAFMLLSATKGA